MPLFRMSPRRLAGRRSCHRRCRARRSGAAGRPGRPADRADPAGARRAPRRRGDPVEHRQRGSDLSRRARAAADDPRRRAGAGRRGRGQRDREGGARDDPLRAAARGAAARRAAGDPHQRAPRAPSCPTANTACTCRSPRSPRSRPSRRRTQRRPQGGFAINLMPIYGITMPIIIRKGELEVTAGLANPRIEQGPEGPAFLVDITRAGTASVYGDLLVYRQGGDEPRSSRAASASIPRSTAGTPRSASRPSRPRRCAARCGSSCASPSRPAAR